MQQYKENQFYYEGRWITIPEAAFYTEEIQ